MSSRKRLSIQEKQEIIEESRKPGFSRSKTCEKYGCSKATLSVLLKQENQDAFLRRIDSSSQSITKRKSLKASKLPVMEERVYEWFLQMRKKEFR